MNQYRIVVTQDEYTTGGKVWIAYHPELHGCLAMGETISKAIANLDDARAAWLAACEDTAYVPSPPRSTFLLDVTLYNGLYPIVWQ